MKKSSKVLFIFLVILIFIGLIIGIFYSIGIFEQAFQSTSPSLIQWTGVPYESGSIISWWSSAARTASSVAGINLKNSNYRFESTVDSKIIKKYCKTLPSDAINVIKLNIDNDNCQHWNYDTPSSSAYYECASGTNCNNMRACCSNWACDDYGYCYSPFGCFPNICYSPKNSAHWQYHPEIISQHINDFGGAFFSFTDPSTGLINYGCYQEIKVYRNNILIDTQYSTNPQIKFYFDDGTFSDIMQEGKGMAIQAVSIGQNYWYQNGLSCSAYQNSYVLKLPENSFIINISSPKSSYIQGENIILNVEVTNNIQEVFGKLEVDFEVPTILGTKTNTQSQDVTIPNGKSTFNYNIPTNVPVELLRVKPRLIVQYKTSNLNGLNYPFESGIIISINSKDRFNLGTIEEDWKNVNIKSLAGYYQEKLNLTEKELSLLNQTLQEKINLVNKYKGNLDEQLKLINQLNTTIDEKAKIINQLNLNLNDQATLVAQLNLSIQEKAKIINELNLNLNDQAELIKKLKVTSEEQGKIINDLQLTITDQASLIKKMQLTVSQQAELLKNLNLTISDQAELINKLTSNLEEKAILVSQLKVTNEEQANLIEKMKLSFKDQADIITKLQELNQNDAEIITSLYKNIDDQSKLINELKYTNEELSRLIKEMKLTISDQAELINKLDKTIQEKAEIISKLNLSVQEDVELIKSLNLKISEQAEIISKLDLSVQEDAILINNLDLTITQQAGIIAKLNLSLEEEKQLISQLHEKISEQEELFNQVQDKKQEIIIRPANIWIIIIPSILIISLIVFLIIYLIKKKK